MPEPEEDESFVPSRALRTLNSQPISKQPVRNKNAVKVLPKKPVKHGKKRSTGGKNIAVIERMSRARASSVSDTTIDDSTMDSFAEFTNDRLGSRKRPHSPAADHLMDYTEAPNDTIVLAEYDPPPTTSNAADFVKVSMVEGDHSIASTVGGASPMEVDEPRSASSESRVLPANPYHWSVDDFGHYLKINGLSDCVEAFRQAQINGRIVMGFTSEQIYGVLDKLGPSLKVSHKVEELKRAFPNELA